MRSTVRLALLLVAAVIVIDALVGDQGLLAAQRRRHERDEMAQRLDRTRSENALRRDEVLRLQDDPDAIEDAARRDLDLIKKGEKVFIIKDLPSP